MVFCLLCYCFVLFVLLFCVTVYFRVNDGRDWREKHVGIDGQPEREIYVRPCNFCLLCV